MSIAIKSTLNPLADSFFPSTCLKTINRDEGSALNEKKMRDLTAGFDLMRLCVVDERSIAPKDLGMKFERSYLEKSAIETIVTGSTLLTNMVKNFLTSESTLCRQKSMLSVRQEHSRVVEHVVDVKESSPVKDQCRCPPMFGWVVPPEFFGNPFNLKYDCSKRHTHISDQTQDCEDVEVLKSQDKNLSNLTLDECYLEVKEILADIFKCVSECSDAEDSLQVAQCEVKSKGHGMDSDCQENLELVDDGCHPLLELKTQSATEYEDEDKESIARVEEVLEDVLKPADSKRSTSRRRVCNPPCSVWCDFVPTTAFGKFESIENKNCEQKYLGRPIYKRSLSENDSYNYTYLSHQKSAEPLEKLTQSRYKDLKKCRILSDSLKRTWDDDSNMWGPFDSADSLWQPLPDCVPSNEQKQTSYRSARDMRRQKSVN